MCICNGTGRLLESTRGSVTYIPCPDTKCNFDKDKADREFKEWQRKGFEYYGEKAV